MRHKIGLLMVCCLAESSWSVWDLGWLAFGMVVVVLVYWGLLVFNRSWVLLVYWIGGWLLLFGVQAFR